MKETTLVRSCPKPTKQDHQRRKRALRRMQRQEIGRPEAEEDGRYRTCWLCGRNGCGDPLDEYHVFGGAYRIKSTLYGAVVYLCHDRCHENGEDAVHRSAETADKLRRVFQKKIMAEQGWTEAEFIREFGRNYI